MNARPIYRWKSFWLGLVVLAFLGWVWARSMGRNEGVTVFGPGVKRFQARICAGVATVYEWEGELDRESIQVTGYSVEYSADQKELQRRWVFASASRDEEGEGVSWIAFPMWVPFVGLLLPWSGWLAWRWRRVLKGTTNIEHRTSNIE
jgi:hypothetical protein